MKSLFFPAGWGLGSRGFSPGLGQQSESTEGGSEVCVCELKAEDEAVEDRRDEWVDGKEKEFMVLMGGRDITGYVSLQKLFRAEEKQQTQTQQ